MSLIKLAVRLMKIPIYIVLVVGPLSTCLAYVANDTNKTIQSDGTFSDTQAAVNYVAGKNQDGWVMTVGSAGGSYTWTVSLSISIPHIFTIQGASSTNRPTINFGSANLRITATADKVTTLKDFIFSNNPGSSSDATVRITGAGLCFRVTNCKFSNQNGSKIALYIGGVNSTHSTGPYGLIDHCQWINTGFGDMIHVLGNGAGDHWGWTQPMTWGTTNTVCVEDCTFTFASVTNAGGLCEGAGGARILVRYCNINNIPFDTHGLQSGAGDGTLQVECLHNHWLVNDSNNTMPHIFWLRGGTAVVSNNVVDNAGDVNHLGSVFNFTVECAEDYWQSEHCTRQLIYPADYPATQQVGRGVVSGAEGSVPVYVWGNTVPSTYWGTYTLTQGFLQLGRDIIVDTAKPGYTELVYPHPLQGSGGPTPPSAPANLRILPGP